MAPPSTKTKKDEEEIQISKELTVLIHRKQRMFEQMQTVYDMSRDLSDSDTVEMFLMHVSELSDLRSSFEKIIFEIFENELQSDPKSTLRSNELKSFDDLYFRVKLCAKQNQPKPQGNNSDNPSRSAGELKVRLPKLELFTFDSNVENFTTFYETFCSMVHNQTHISKIEKFHYLLSCVKGPALNIIKSLPITANNYDLVWQSLIDKYHDNRLLLGRYLDKMLNFQPLTKESPDNLSTFIENFDFSYKAIQALDIKDLNNYVICHIALRALDPQSRKTFELKLDQNSIPTFEELISFIHNQIKVLNHAGSYMSTPLERNKSQLGKKQVPSSSSKNYSHAVSTRVKMSCLHCGDNKHMIYRCDRFRELTVDQRISRANELKLCYSCLKPGHFAGQSCKSNFKCFICQSPNHNVLLHRETLPCRPVDVPTDFEPCSKDAPTAALVNKACSLSSNTNISTNVLGTAIVHVMDAYGNYHSCRALIDSCAQTNFISVECYNRLGLKSVNSIYDVYGLGGEHVKNYGMVSCTLKPRDSTSVKFSLDAVILRKITSDMPTVPIPDKVISAFKNLTLADPQYYETSPIDIIIAADIFPYVYDGRKIIIDYDMPVALGSVFGYVITGKLALPSGDLNVVPRTALHTTFLVTPSENNELNNTLKRFWETETLPCEVPLNPLDELAEKIYAEKHYRDKSGRYVSPILLNPNHEPIGDSHDVALKRLTQVERRLARSPELHKAYVDFMREYEALGHMELYKGTEPSAYLIPHHCVLRPSSTSTPLRVVFDGSAHANNGISLNDALLTGKKLLPDLLKIIMNFRLFEVCFSADVSKMFRAVLIDPADRKYQHILWRESPSEPVRTYELKTNTYGLRSAPYVAVRTLHQLAADELSRAAPRVDAARVVTQGFYVDDLLWSCQSKEQACKLQDELLELLSSGGFELRKWASNCPELLDRMNSDQVSAIDFHDDTLSSSLKVLGLTWQPSCDSFAFNYNMTDTKQTKRSVLKLLASIFDPVGLISPCTFVAKCIMQDVWKLGISDWDCQLPPEPCSQWNRFIAELPLLSDLRFERHVLIPDVRDIQLVAFCDASSRGMATCIYLRSENGCGDVKVRLLASKSKVAPLNPILSIPRLELEAARLLSKLVSFVVQNLTNVEFSIIALSDSKNVLAWLQTQPYMLKTFVANRVSQITAVVPPSSWFHVKGESNAADIGSRGVLPSRFVEVATEWIHGPAWLYKNRQDWPIESFQVTKDIEVSELKSNSATFALASSSDRNVFCNDLEETFEKFSSFNRLQRVISWCHRFINNLRCRSVERSVGPLISSELKQAHNSIIRVLQMNHFDSEMTSLKQGKFVASLRKLSPFVDSHNFLRVGGRLVQAALPYNTKHPVLLPKCHTSRLLINYLHRKHLHVGPRTLQGILCRNYWLVGARNVIRSVLSKCKICFKCQPMALQPEMGSLPAPRLQPHKIWDHVGCDLGGPFLVKESLRRNAKVHKAYLCLFIDFSVKAVHCEVLSSLSCECFLAAYDRFVARRGLSSCLYSDCGTNFVSAAKHLKEVAAFWSNKQNKDEILSGLTARQVEWRTNPPNAASMGGIWEAGIKQCKHLLLRAVGDKSLTFEELSTVFCRVEAVLNSRPLCPLSDNPNEFEALTAGHFLIGQTLVAVPEYEFDEVPQNRLSRWQHIQKVSQTFWRRWSDDYLHTLQQRAKWFKSPPNLKIGDLVLLKSNLTRPLQWPLGRIEATHEGVDKVVRVVTVRTQNGLIKRPVNKVCPLPYAN